MTIEFETLVGRRMLSGVDQTYLGDATGIAFVLDGRGYAAFEDENDGYRSCMGDFVEVEIDTIKNRFDSIAVLARVADDFLIFTDEVTGKDVLTIGTDESDQYYPSFVGNFEPQNMVLNQNAA